MHISEIKEHLATSPFVPFRIFLSDGSSFEVPHPDFALLTKWAVHVAHDSTNSDEIPERVSRLAVGHITRIEEIDPGSAVPA
jgi:hypothetical protein